MFLNFLGSFLEVEMHFYSSSTSSKRVNLKTQKRVALLTKNFRHTDVTFFDDFFCSRASAEKKYFIFHGRKEEIKMARNFAFGATTRR
jgi:hypothetical protein